MVCFGESYNLPETAWTGALKPPAPHQGGTSSSKGQGWAGKRKTASSGPILTGNPAGKQNGNILKAQLGC